MKKMNSTVILTVLLIVLSITLYSFQLVRFDAPRDTAFYFLQDLAFLPLQVAIVTIVLGEFLSARERREQQKKTNMMIGTFFSEIGNELIDKLSKLLCSSEAKSNELQTLLDIGKDWSDKDFKKAVAAIKRYHFGISLRVSDLQDLRELLSQKRIFVLTILANPNLLEHEEFTDMLWAVFHLTDELQARESVADLPAGDIEHLNNDVRRVLNPIFAQWMSFMCHLKSDYPYLYSLEMRRNPFEGEERIIIR